MVISTPNSIRQLNIRELSAQPSCQALIQNMQKTEKFLNDFGFLSFGRDWINCGKYLFSLQQIITSAGLTAGSIISCCKSVCIADANSLLRKYRDDLFFYLYISIFDYNYKLGDNRKITENIKKSIERWVENDLSDLHIGYVMKAIGTTPKVQDAINKYGLKKHFERLSNRLNDYVHSNGYSFYNLNINSYSDNDLYEHLKKILHDLRFITVSFLFLLTLFSPLSIMSIDYISSLDCGFSPEEGSQYWVAPFVERYFKENIDLIDEGCLNYLRENTPMIFKE